MTLAAFTTSDAVDVALVVFLVLIALTLGYAFFRIGSTLGQLSRTVRNAEEELLPVLNKVGGTLDRVNLQLDHVDAVTSRAASAVGAVDGVVRGLSGAVGTPIQKLTGLVAGVQHGASSLKTNRSWGEAVRTAKDAAARREADLQADLDDAGRA